MQVNLIQRYLKEVEKIKEDKDDPNVLSKLATNIIENTKMLAELRLCPPILYRLRELIPKNVRNIQNNKIALKNIISRNNKLAREPIKSDIYFPIDPEPVIDPKEDPQRVF